MNGSGTQILSVHRRSTLLIASALLTSACGESPTRTAWTQTDSAGVSILSGPPPEQEFARVDSQPLSEISEADGSPLFRATATLPREDGSYVVLDAGNHRLLLFDVNHRFVASVGEQGDGPGEFQGPALAVTQADSTLVYDAPQRRVTVFGPDLELVRDRLLEGPQGAAPPRFVGAFGDGLWVGALGQAPVGIPPRGLLRGSVRYVALDGAAERTLGSGRGSERWVHVETSGGEITTMNVIGYPFYRSSIALVTGDRFVHGDTDAWILSIRDGKGQLQQSVRMDLPLKAFGSAGIPDYLNTLADLLPEERRARENDLASIDVPETLPAFSELMADDDQRLWVRAFALNRAAAQEWYVFGDAGALGWIRMPDGFELKAAHGGRLYGVFRDDLDVETVRIYGFVELN